MVTLVMTLRMAIMRFCGVAHFDDEISDGGSGRCSWPVVLEVPAVHHRSIVSCAQLCSQKHGGRRLHVEAFTTCGHHSGYVAPPEGWQNGARTRRFRW